MSELLAQWVTFVRGDLRHLLDEGERTLRERLAALAETSGPLAEELLAGRIVAAEQRCAELEAELAALSQAVTVRRDAYLAAVETAFAEAEALLPAYEACRARDDLAAAAEALGEALDGLSPAQLSATLGALRDEIERQRRSVRRRFAAAAATLADSPVLAGGLERARERHAAARADSESQWQALAAGGHAVAAEVRAGVEGMTLPQLQDLTAFLDQSLSDVEVECALAPRINVFGELDAWR